MPPHEPPPEPAPHPEDPLAGYPAWLRRRLAWFQDQKFGFFAHWGPYSQWPCSASWPLSADAPWARPEELAPWREAGRDLERFRAAYHRLPETFHPTRFDPDAWARAAAGAGMRYVCFTTKHHDGFCMWDTATTDYRVTHPTCAFHDDPRADIVGQVFDAFRAHGLGVSCYLSKSDWHCPWYWRPGRPAPDRNPNYDPAAEPAVWERFVRFVHEQVRELMAGYGPVDLLWLDGGQVRPPRQDIRIDELVAMARELQPGLIVADRTVGGPHENIITPEQTIPEAPLGRPWESCLTLGTRWTYQPDDEYKSVRTLVRMLMDIVARGGNLLLGVGPAPDGTLPGPARERLAGVGRWLEVNAEAVYHTRPAAPYDEGAVRFTRREGEVYATVLAADGADRPPPTVALAGLQPPDGATVRLLGRAAPLSWERRDGRAVIRLPQEDPPCRHAWALAFPAPAGRGTGEG